MLINKLLRNKKEDFFNTIRIFHCYDDVGMYCEYSKCQYLQI